MRVKSSHPSLFTKTGTNVLWLVFYLVLACILMLGDYHQQWLGKIRYQASFVIRPLYHAAGLPSRIVNALQTVHGSRQSLRLENQRLRHELLMADARLNRLQAISDQNHKLRQLLSTQRELRVGVQLAQLIDIDVGAFGNRIVLDVGAEQGVEPGQAIIDADGVMGQIVKVSPRTSMAMLITDPEAAIPIVVARTGLRLIAYGAALEEVLRLPNIPINADIREGDTLLTSGIGGTYPAGFPVGTISRIQADAGAAARVALALPAAKLNYSDTVLVVQRLAAPMGPPATIDSYGPPIPEALAAPDAAEDKP